MTREDRRPIETRAPRRTGRPACPPCSRGGSGFAVGLGPATVRCAARINDHVLRFLVRRLDEDRRTIRDLGQCRTPSEGVAVWTRFVQTAARQYAEEAAGFYLLMVEQSQEIGEEVRDAVSGAATPSPVVPLPE